MNGELQQVAENALNALYGYMLANHRNPEKFRLSPDAYSVGLRHLRERAAEQIGRLPGDQIDELLQRIESEPFWLHGVPCEKDERLVALQVVCEP